MKTVDTRGWKSKRLRVKEAVAQQAAKSIAQASQIVFDKAMENLSGYHPVPETSPTGRQYFPSPDGGASMPIRVLTGTLRRSLKMRPVTTLLWQVYADSKVASYAKYVHEGTKHMRPRRFLQDPVWLYGASIIKKIGHDIKTEIRRVGR